MSEGTPLVTQGLGFRASSGAMRGEGLDSWIRELASHTLSGMAKKFKQKEKKRTLGKDSPLNLIK